jgi:uncharacterized protein YbcV (DUF1398 family)
MIPEQTAAAQACHAGAIEGHMTFPTILATLAASGFEGYLVDLRHGTARYYLTSGDSADCTGPAESVALSFDVNTLQSAIREAQTSAPGYTYSGFCRKAAQAGCAGYLVSLPGRRVLYFGRSGETHVEHFPDAI